MNNYVLFIADVKKITLQPEIISERLLLYQNGLEQAKYNGELSKVRRYKRSIVVIEELLQSANAGQQINEEALPPVIIVKKVDSIHSKVLVETNKSECDSQSKHIACSSANYITPQPEKVARQLDLDTPEYSEFDLSDADLDLLASSFIDDRNQKSAEKVLPKTASQSLPPKLLSSSSSVTKEQIRMVLVERRDQYRKAMQLSKNVGNAADQKQYGIFAVQFERVIKSFDNGMPVDLTGTPPPPPGFKSQFGYDISQYQSSQPSHPTLPQSSVTPEVHDEAENELDTSIPTPKTTLEALHQRLVKYREGLKHSKEKGETSRIRRLSRIVKQYEDAIKHTTTGKYIDYSELPSPPGYPPLPMENQNPTHSQSNPGATQSLPVGVMQPKVKPSVSDVQLQNLQRRAREYHQAGRDAKAEGDTDSALLYLRYYKAIQPMIKLALAGLPIDMTQVSNNN